MSQKEVKIGRVNIPYKSRNRYDYISQSQKGDTYTSQIEVTRQEFWNKSRPGSENEDTAEIYDEDYFTMGSFVKTGDQIGRRFSVKGHVLSYDFIGPNTLSGYTHSENNNIVFLDVTENRRTGEFQLEDKKIWTLRYDTSGATGYTIGQSLQVGTFTFTSGGTSYTLSPEVIFLSETSSYEILPYSLEDVDMDDSGWIGENETSQETITLTFTQEYGEWADSNSSYSGYFIQASADKDVLDPINIFVDGRDSDGGEYSDLHYTINQTDTDPRTSKAYSRKDDWIEKPLVGGTVKVEVDGADAIYEIVNNIEVSGDNIFVFTYRQNANKYVSKRMGWQRIKHNTVNKGGTLSDESDSPNNYSSFEDWYDANEGIGGGDEKEDIPVYQSDSEYIFNQKISGNNWYIDSSGNAHFNNISAVSGLNTGGSGNGSGSGGSDSSQGGVTPIIPDNYYATKTYVDSQDTSLYNYINTQMNEKFVLISQSGYDNLVNKDENKIYLIY